MRPSSRPSRQSSSSSSSTWQAYERAVARFGTALTEAISDQELAFFVAQAKLDTDLESDRRELERQLQRLHSARRALLESTSAMVSDDAFIAELPASQVELVLTAGSARVVPAGAAVGAAAELDERRRLVVSEEAAAQLRADLLAAEEDQQRRQFAAESARRFPLGAMDTDGQFVLRYTVPQAMQMHLVRIATEQRRLAGLGLTATLEELVRHSVAAAAVESAAAGGGDGHNHDVGTWAPAVAATSSVKPEDGAHSNGGGDTVSSPTADHNHNCHGHHVLPVILSRGEGEGEEQEEEEGKDTAEATAAAVGRGSILIPSRSGAAPPSSGDRGSLKRAYFYHSPGLTRLPAAVAFNSVNDDDCGEVEATSAATVEQQRLAADKKAAAALLTAAGPLLNTFLAAATAAELERTRKGFDRSQAALTRELAELGYEATITTSPVGGNDSSSHDSNGGRDRVRVALVRTATAQLADEEDPRSTFAERMDTAGGAVLSPREGRWAQAHRLSEGLADLCRRRAAFERGLPAWEAAVRSSLAPDLAMGLAELRSHTAAAAAAAADEEACGGSNDNGTERPLSRRVTAPVASASAPRVTAEDAARIVVALRRLSRTAGAVGDVRATAASAANNVNSITATDGRAMIHTAAGRGGPSVVAARVVVADSENDSNGGRDDDGDADADRARNGARPPPPPTPTPPQSAPTRIDQIVQLPAETPETAAYLARHYLWPAALEARIAHSLRGNTDAIRGSKHGRRIRRQIKAQGDDGGVKSEGGIVKLEENTDDDRHDDYDSGNDDGGYDGGKTEEAKLHDRPLGSAHHRRTRLNRSHEIERKRKREATRVTRAGWRPPMLSAADVGGLFVQALRHDRALASRHHQQRQQQLGNNGVSGRKRPREALPPTTTTTCIAHAAAGSSSDAADLFDHPLLSGSVVAGDDTDATEDDIAAATVVRPSDSATSEGSVVAGANTATATATAAAVCYSVITRSHAAVFAEKNRRVLFNAAHVVAGKLAAGSAAGAYAIRNGDWRDVCRRGGDEYERGGDEEQDSSTFTTTTTSHNHSHTPAQTTLQRMKRMFDRRFSCSFLPLPRTGTATLLRIDGAGDYMGYNALMTSTFANGSSGRIRRAILSAVAGGGYTGRELSDDENVDNVDDDDDDAVDDEEGTEEDDDDDGDGRGRGIGVNADDARLANLFIRQEKF